MAGGLPKQDSPKGERIRRRIDANERKSTRFPFADGKGKLIVNVEVPTSPTFVDVDHGLGVKPRGVLVLAVRHASATASVVFPKEVCDSTGLATDRTNKILRLYNGGTASMFVDLWVY